MTTILSYLDEKLNAYYQKNNVWPGKIIFSKETKDKIFAELELEPTMDNSWRDSKDNYRGIPISISNIEEIKLK